MAGFRFGAWSQLFRTDGESERQVVGVSNLLVSRFRSHRKLIDSWLDSLALATIWLVVVPIWHYHGTARIAALAARIVISIIYAVDFLNRFVHASDRSKYLSQTWFEIVVIFVPPLRVVTSVRVFRSIFRRGELKHLVLVAFVLLVNIAIVAYLFERDARGATIKTVGDALWWSIVTATTVGYGDFTTITLIGRIAAVAAMLVGIVTIATVTATVAANFMTISSEPSTEAQSLNDARGSSGRSSNASESRKSDLDNSSVQPDNMLEELHLIRLTLNELTERVVSLEGAIRSSIEDGTTSEEGY